MGIKDTVFSKKRTVNINGNLLSLDFPLIMGILNLSHDSFYDGGSYKKSKEIVTRVEQMLSEGADIIDIGACSSKPGASGCTEKEELKLLIPALEIIRKKFPESIISIDTFRSGVAKKVVKDYEVNIINDISAGEMDEKMFQTIAELQVIYLIMHMQGNPQTMQDKPEYSNVIKEISLYFSEKITRLKALGINDIIIDPGFGFGKTIEHNYEILHNLNAFQIFDLPLCVGLSRKSMIYKVLKTDPENALNGTITLNTISLMKGVDILRVHDIKEAKETIQLTIQYKG